MCITRLFIKELGFLSSSDPSLFFVTDECFSFVWHESFTKSIMNIFDDGRAGDDPIEPLFPAGVGIAGVASDACRPRPIEVL